MLEIEIGADQPALLAVMNRTHRQQRRLHIGEPVQLESRIGLQQMEIARMGQQRDRPLDGALDRTQRRQIAGDRGSLVQAINILRDPPGIGRRVERRDAADRGDILLDPPDLGLVAGGGSHRARYQGSAR